MNLKELSLFLTDELFVIKEEVNEKLAINKMASRLDLNASAEPIVANEPELQPNAIEHDPEPIPYEGGFKKSILIVYEGEELKESNRAFLLKVFSAVNLSLKDIALMSEHSLKGSNEDPIEQLNPDKMIIFGTIYHHLMRLKKDNYHIMQESLDYFFADDLDGLENNVSLKENYGIPYKYFSILNKSKMTNEERLGILQRFRIVSLTEGTSMLVLVFIAMPLKYIFDLPAMVTYVGWIHGVLFVVYILVMFPTSRKLRWHFRIALMGLIASVLPFGPFLFDRKLRKQEHIIEDKM